MGKPSFVGLSTVLTMAVLSSCSGRAGIQNGQNNTAASGGSALINGSSGAAINQRIESESIPPGRMDAALPNGVKVAASGSLSAGFQGQNGQNNVAAQDKSSVISGSPNATINQFNTNVYQGLSEDRLRELLKDRDKEIKNLQASVEKLQPTQFKLENYFVDHSTAGDVHNISLIPVGTGVVPAVTVIAESTRPILDFEIIGGPMLQMGSENISPDKTAMMKSIQNFPPVPFKIRVRTQTGATTNFKIDPFIKAD